MLNYAHKLGSKESSYATIRETQHQQEAQMHVPRYVITGR